MVSKKFIGERKIAKAIRSCSFRLAYEDGISMDTACVHALDSGAFIPHHAYLDRAKNPEDERLDDPKSRGSHTECEVDANIFAHMRIPAVLLVDFGPLLEPHAPACRPLAPRISSRCENMRKEWPGVLFVILTNRSSLRTNKECQIECNSNKVADLCILAVD